MMQEESQRTWKFPSKVEAFLDLCFKVYYDSIGIRTGLAANRLERRTKLPSTFRCSNIAEIVLSVATFNSLTLVIVIVYLILSQWKQTTILSLFTQQEVWPKYLVETCVQSTILGQWLKSTNIVLLFSVPVQKKRKQIWLWDQRIKSVRWSNFPRASRSSPRWVSRTILLEWFLLQG